MKDNVVPTDALSSLAGFGHCGATAPLLADDFPWHRIRRLPRK
ncbi:hypothetical protein [Herbaspirillum sp. LeCh32-8]|nr:hypothetical protein [Herbaspirillum sp. LeCh32-8]